MWLRATRSQGSCGNVADSLYSEPRYREPRSLLMNQSHRNGRHAAPGNGRSSCAGVATGNIHDYAFDLPICSGRGRGPVLNVLRNPQLQKSNNRPSPSAAAGAEIRARSLMVDRQGNNRVAAADAGNALQRRIRIVVAAAYRDRSIPAGRAAIRQQLILPHRQPLTPCMDQTLRSFVGMETGPAADRDRLPGSHNLAATELKG